MRNVIRGLCISLLMTVLFGCVPSVDEDAIVIDFEVSLSVSGLVDTTLTEADFNKMPFVEETITRIGRDGTEFVYQVKGILLKDVLTYLDVDPEVVSLEAEDGYSQTYDQAMYDDPLTILAFFNEGEPLSEEDGPMWMFAGNFTGNFWIRQLVKIIIT